MTTRLPFFCIALLSCLLEATSAEETSRAYNEAPITDSDRDHWSFHPIVRPSLPAVRKLDWLQTPIDRFILSDLESANIAPSPHADRATILRRLKFDLLGLPPTPGEIHRFENDESPNAYATLVDSMLGSPAYGERWAQHWLDLARFAETDGFEHDKIRPAAWKYRQWVIDALNADMPYDRFVRLQILGDLSESKSDAIATVFCLAGPDMPDINEQDLRRHDKLNELTSTIGAVLLGLQMHCAQCHDHKFDPISQGDFYRLRGIFESAVPQMKRDKSVLQLRAQPRPISPWFYFRGELANRGKAVDPQPPRIACSADASLDFDTDRPRAAFVDWLFGKENPLTARVIANRIWQHHFGRSLCENPSDFGIMASGPSHPELLDWLASELRDNAWSMKHLHRVILNSATYRQTSRPAPDVMDSSAWNRALEQDRDNDLYSRFPRKRLEGEVIRDAMLAVSGRLNREQGGPSVLPPLPDELVSTLLRGQWKTSENRADHCRRSIYVFARRNLRYPIFDVFDRPDGGTTCARRDKSTTPIQSLHMLNSDLTLECARALRDRLRNEVSVSNQQELRHRVVERLFLLAFGRKPQLEEFHRFQEALSSPASYEHDLLTCCIAVLNANEFLYVD